VSSFGVVGGCWIGNSTAAVVEIVNWRDFIIYTSGKKDSFQQSNGNATVDYTLNHTITKIPKMIANSMDRGQKDAALERIICMFCLISVSRVSRTTSARSTSTTPDTAAVRVRRSSLPMRRHASTLRRLDTRLFSTGEWL